MLDAHESPTMSAERLEVMRDAAQAKFSRALVDRGTEPSRFRLVVHIDELVGPMAFVVELADRCREWSLPAFQAWLGEN